MTNPYDLNFLAQFMGQQETQRLFKSSRDLRHENSQKRGKFLSDRIVPTVSAFLNTDGGQVVFRIGRGVYWVGIASVKKSGILGQQH